MFEWQFIRVWQWPWHHRSFDDDYGEVMHWAGFAFWQFRWIMPK